MTDLTPLPVNTRLMSRCAEMLALPHAVCRRRQCHRKNACYWHFRKSGEPCCLRNLTGQQRAAFDALYAEAIAVLRQVRASQLPDFAPPDPERRALQDAAIELVRSELPAEYRPRFEEWRRGREAAHLPLEGEERSAQRSNRSSESIAATNARSESEGPVARSSVNAALSPHPGASLLGDEPRVSSRSGNPASRGG